MSVCIACGTTEADRVPLLTGSNRIQFSIRRRDAETWESKEFGRSGLQNGCGAPSHLQPLLSGSMDTYIGVEEFVVLALQGNVDISKTFI